MCLLLNCSEGLSLFNIFGVIFAVAGILVMWMGLKNLQIPNKVNVVDVVTSVLGLISFLAGLVIMYIPL